MDLLSNRANSDWMVPVSATRSIYQQRRAEEAETADYGRFLSILAVSLLTLVTVEQVRSSIGF